MTNIVAFPSYTVFAIVVHYTDAESGELMVHQHNKVFVSRRQAIAEAPKVAENFGLVAWIDELEFPGAHSFCYIDGEAIVTTCTIV